MYEFNTTITDEGAILLTRIIEWHEYATFKKLWFSENNYVGQEATLTADTFGGVFATENVSASIIDNTTIKISAAILSPAQDDTLYSIGVIMDDNGTNVLVAVCTTSDPMPISQGAGNRFAFNINLTVSSTSDITVVGTTAAVLYDTDIVDNLTTADATKVLSANMGVKIANNLAANENVYGAKNQLKNNLLTTTVGDVTYTVNDDKSITVSGTPTGSSYVEMRGFTIPKGVHILSGIQGYTVENMKWDSVVLFLNGSVVHSWTFGGSGTIDDVEIDTSPYTYDEVDVVLSRNYPNVACSGTVYPMIRDARIIDPTFAPYAETNLQLTRKTSGVSNRNLVDNGWFTVNQRGTSGSYQNGYMADRWFAAGFTSSNVTTNITNNGAVIQSNGTYGWRVKQNIENYKDLSGRKVTYSINVKSISSDFISLLYAPSLNGINEDWVWLGNASTTGIISVTFTLPDLSSASGLCLMFQSDTPIDVTIRAVKLEVGSVSTLHLDVAPDYTTELLKCQRYLAPAGWCVVTKNSNNLYVGTVKLPVPLRDTPTIPTPTLTDVLWCPGSGYFTPESVSTNVRDTYKNTTISFTFAGSALTEPCYVYNSGVLVSAEP